VARRIVDAKALRLIKLWPSSPVEERDSAGRRRMSGGRSHRKGTQQGSVISPLLANLYMNRFLKFWRLRECGRNFRARVVNYADDFVILSCGHAAEALAWTTGVMAKLGLTINEAKTSLKNARVEGFEPYLGARPSMKSLKRIKGKIGDLLRPCEMGAWPQVRKRLNCLLGGWSAYFGYGTLNAAYRAVDRHVCDRVRRFLNRRAKRDGRGARAFSWAKSRDARRQPPDPRQTARVRREPDMNSVGKPDAANPHVRFDERGRETEPLAKPQRHRALPRLYNPQDW
jgi:RNA-directed DNA polymerase